MNWEQFKALLKVRHQLSRNQGRKAGGLNLILYDIFRIIVFVGSSGLFFAATIGGAFWFSTARTGSALAAWNVVVIAFLVFWFLDLLQQMYQTEFISLESLLHLPVTLQRAFMLNYISSFNSKNIILFAPLMIGMAIGMGCGRGGFAWLALPMVLAFLFVITTVSFQVRGWLANLMKNKRTKSIIAVIIPLLFIVAVTVPRFLDYSFNMRAMINPTGSIPTGWLPLDIVNAEQGSWAAGLLSVVAMVAIGSGSLFFAFRTCLKMHRGEGRGRSSGRTRSATAIWETKWLFQKLPFVTDAVSSVALFNMRSLSRAPEAMMALLPLVAAVVFGIPYLTGFNGLSLPVWLFPWLPMSVMIITMLGFPAFLFSCFSYDRDGFRSFVLSPLRRKDILLGKNLAVGIPTVISGWLMLTILQILAPVGWLAFVANLIQIPATFFLLCILGNIASVFFPVGLKRGSMQPVNTSFIPMVVLYVTILLGPFAAVIPMNFTFGIPYTIQMVTGQSFDWLYFCLSVVQLLISWAVYVWTLNDTGHWLWERESRILEAVANIPE